MNKIDFKKTLRVLYSAPAHRFALVDVPQMRFVMVDGEGDPNVAPSYRRGVEWLFSVSYAMKFAAKASLERDYVAPPLEGLWWADDPADFVARRKDRWLWTMMVTVPDFVDAAMFSAAQEKTATKLGSPPDTFRFETYGEGRSLQILHLGSYDDEGPTLERLHHQVMPSMGLTFAGKHHEIYLSDPRKTAAARLRTILRQPVRPLL